MAYEIKNEFVSKELENEISAAIKERRSVEQLLEEKEFLGIPCAIEELVHILVKYMGAPMALEFVFTANRGDWEDYRNILNKLWDKISVSENFNIETKLILGQFLYQREQKDLAMKFIRRAAINAGDVKTMIAVAQVINHDVKNRSWVKEILLCAKETAETADDYAIIAKRFIELIDDKDESRKAIEKAVKKAQTFTEFTGVAVAILKSFDDREWAKLVFETGLPKKDTSSVLDTLAEEEYAEVLDLLNKR